MVTEGIIIIIIIIIIMFLFIRRVVLFFHDILSLQISAVHLVVFDG